MCYQFEHKVDIVPYDKTTPPLFKHISVNNVIWQNYILGALKNIF